MFVRDTEKERVGGGGGKSAGCWASGRKENTEIMGEYIFSGGLHRRQFP